MITSKRTMQYEETHDYVKKLLNTTLCIDLENYILNDFVIFNMRLTTTRTVINTDRVNIYFIGNRRRCERIRRLDSVKRHVK